MSSNTLIWYPVLLKMMNKFFNILYVLLFLFFSINASSKNIILKEINRLSFDDINSLTSFDLNSKNISKNDLNIIVKELISNELITNISTTFDNDNFYLIISEALFINKIFINNNLKIKDNDIYDSISIKSKNFINNDSISNDIDIIKYLYSSIGYTDIIVSHYLELYSDNSYNLIFDIKENSKKSLNKITFHGNNFFITKYLKSIIQSKEKKFFSFFSKINYLNQNVISNDLALLKNLYSDYGFLNININYEINEVRGNYILDFYIEESSQFTIENIDYSITDNINNILNSEEILLINNNLINSNYSLANINQIIDKLNNSLIDNNLPNYSFDYSYVLTSNNGVDLKIFSSQIDPIIINKINFFGNAITKDTTLRKQIYVNPGDIFNKRNASKSKNNLEKNSYIENANFSLSAIDNNSSDLNITLIEKKKTGNFFLGAGYDSLDGASTSVGLSDDNFYGTGNKIDSNLTVSSNKILFSIDYNKFYFLDYNLDNSYKLYNTQDDLSKTHGYKTTSYGLGFNVKLPYKYNVNIDEYFNIGATYDITDVYSIKTTASTSVFQNKGETSNFILKSGYVNDSRNDNFNPTDGHMNSLSLSVSPSIISDDDYFKVIATNNYFYPILRNTGNLFLLSKIGFASGLDKKLKTKDSFSLGGRDFKGFRHSGIGPRDNNLSYLGGSNLYVITAGYSSPVIFDNSDSLVLKYFATIGSLSNSGYKSTFDSDKPRASVGMSLDVVTPVGPLSMSLANVLSKETYDKEESFNVSIGTSF